MLIPEGSRAEAHLRIGRLLWRTCPKRSGGDYLRDCRPAQPGRGLDRFRDEREELVRLNLTAGKRAKASAAYAAAFNYFSAGAALLPGDCWERQREFAFSLEINRAECEFLTGQYAAAEQLLGALSSRAANTMERAAVACLFMDLYMTLGQTGHAVAIGLDYLGHLGICWQPHPTEEEARRDYGRIWSKLGNRAIEDFVNLPLMSDPASLATMDVLIKLGPAAKFTDANLSALIACKAVDWSLEHGNSDGSCWAYVSLGYFAGPRFGDYEAGFRFGQLGYDLVEQRGLERFRARVHMIAGVFIVPWMRHVLKGRDLLLSALESANRTGDLTYAGYTWNSLITNLIAAGDPLAEVQTKAGGRPILRAERAVRTDYRQYRFAARLHPDAARADAEIRFF